MGNPRLNVSPTVSWILWTVATVLVLAASILATSAEEPPGQWVVVTPPSFRPALSPLIEHRQAEGFKVVVLETSDVLSQAQLNQGNGAPLQARLNELFRNYQGRSILLLAGTFNTNGLTNPASVVVPSLRGAVLRMKGQLSDHPYGVPGPDGMSAVAVGRFPARTVEELSSMVEKTLRFEEDLQPAPWRNRLVLLAGDPGGGPLADIFMQQNLSAHLASLFPYWEVRTIFNVPESPYYLPRPQARQTALLYLRDGGMFSIYCGHSGPDGLDLDGRFITRRDWSELNMPSGRGPFFTVGCFACQSDGREESYGLAAIRNPSGPVAVIGATGESFSAPGQLAVEGLLNCLNRQPFPPRLADYWLGVQAGLARGPMDPATFAVLDAVDGTEGKTPLAPQRVETLEMWILFGDPALRLPLAPVDISLTATKAVTPGGIISVSGTLPERLSDAAVRITAARPLTSLPPGLEKVPANSPENRDARLRAFMTNHLRANSFILATAETKSAGTHFSVSLQMPADLPWSNVVLRASATLANQQPSLGVITVPVSASEPAPP